MRAHVCGWPAAAAAAMVDPMTDTASPVATAPLTLAFMGGEVTLRLTAAHTGGALCVHDHRLPAGAATPLHVQADDEAFFVLEGAFEFVVGDQRAHAPVDAMAFAPRGVPHAFRVVSPEGGRILIMGAPAGHEQFFIEAGDPVDSPAPLDLERMARAAALTGVELLGPPPFDA